MQTLRVFPHDPAFFPTQDHLTMWMMTSLKARGGTYHLISPESRAVPAERNLDPGSIVLFRHKHHLVGEAIVRKFEKKESTTPEGQCQGVVTFVPSSIRLYSPPISVDEVQLQIDDSLQDETRDITNPRGYPGIKWDIYPKVLALVTKNGSLI